jgi:hypothetical protein
MAEHRTGESQVDARVVYWGVDGSGKTTNLKAIFAKLRPDHRSVVQEIPTRFDPSVSYEVLPIELGEISGVRTRIQIVAVPGAPEHGPTRKQLLDRVDGIVMVVDSSRERLDDNLASLDELRTCLAAYGRSLDDVPLVVQYNKRDLADPYYLEDLHRKLDPGGSAVFEAVASEGTGVLQTLSTISKRVIRSLREPAADAAGGAQAAQPSAPAPEPAPAAPPRAPDLAPSERMERAILAEAGHPESDAIESATRATEDLLDAPAWPEVSGEIERTRGVRIGPGLSIVSVGQATRVGDRKLRVPIVLGDPDGETATLALTIELDPLVDEHR